MVCKPFVLLFTPVTDLALTPASLGAPLGGCGLCVREVAVLRGLGALGDGVTGAELVRAWNERVAVLCGFPLAAGHMDAYNNIIIRWKECTSGSCCST